MATARSPESSPKAVFVYPVTGSEVELELEGATQRYLKQFLKLPRFPNALINKETHQVVLFKGKGVDSQFSNLEPGAVYEVQLNEDAGDAAEAPSQSTNPSAKNNEVDIQRAMVCCQAIYQDEPEKVLQFLNKRENLVLHNFGEVCVSKYGRLTYMLAAAETDDKSELFIAFRGLTLSPSDNRDARDTPLPATGHATINLARCAAMGPVGGMHKLQQQRGVKTRQGTFVENRYQRIRGGGFRAQHYEEQQFEDQARLAFRSLTPPSPPVHPTSPAAQGTDLRWGAAECWIVRNYSSNPVLA
uniref:Uncharacterized protein n=1 Tax=Branchiostoma floridae TaxID=7739 RepID=C3ZPA2_BRAFL|eukprot:XP_002589588.1 hypothetical protein BRAFLDRAFT_81558 [Branchiostoma floridae]